jgi:hypothetical protein
MAIELISEPQYKVTGQPGLEGLTFTGSSKDYLTWPAAVKFCADKRSVLQSLREAAGFRSHADGADDADLYQATRTAAVYFVEGGKRYVAIDDSADPEKNIILARAQEGYDACRKNDAWLLPFNDKHVKQIRARAEKDGRIVEVPKDTEWSLKDSYAAQPIVKALLGDMAEANAAYLLKNDFKKGYVWTPEQTSEAKADVRAVGLGGDGVCIDRDGIVAVRRLDGYDGRARGVRPAQKVSSGN